MDIMKFIEENLVLVIILAVIAVLIIALLIAMIVLQSKAKKKAKQVAAEEAALKEQQEQAAAEKAQAEKQAAPAPAEQKSAAVKKPAVKAKTDEKEDHMKTNETKPAAKQSRPTSPYVFKPSTATPAEKKNETPAKSGVGGKWVVEEVKGKFWFSLYAPNGQVMLESATPYATLQNAKAGIKTYQDNIAAGRLEITEHKNGDFQVQVLNARGGLLSTSSTYSSRSQAESASASIKRWATSNVIEEAEKE